MASNWFVALHKDPARPDALRPIGMGTAWCRILGKHCTLLVEEPIAELLTPCGQFGTSVRGGINFIVHSARVAVERHMQPGQETRAIPLIDLENLFNKASREAARDEPLSHPALRQLVPFFDLLCEDIIKCFFLDGEGHIQCFFQIEGHCQGCPLGPLLSCLTLLHLLEKLKPLLEACARARTATLQPGNDGQGSEGLTVAHFDDCTPILHPDDVTPHLEMIRIHGQSLGLCLNCTKTKLFTTTTGISVTTAPTTPRTTSLCAALQCITDNAPSGLDIDPEITTGARLLGQPIGSPAFARAFLANALQQCINNLEKLKHSGLDQHACLLLFTSCAQPSLTHLCQSDDVHCNAPLPLPEDLSLFSWESTFATGMCQANGLFLAHIADANPSHFTDLSNIVTHHPTAQGGLGHREPAAVALPLTLISLTRSLRCAVSGITIAKGRTLTLAPAHSQIFAAWETSQKRTCALHRTCTPLLRIASNEVTATHSRRCLDLSSFLLHAPLQGLSPKLHACHRRHKLQLFLAAAPDSDTVCFPSILSTLTSRPLTLCCRTRPCNRLEDDTLIPLLQRKLRLPVLPPSLVGQICPCCTKTPQTLDAHGDHLFSCNGIVKAAFHNTIRDAMHFICQQLAPLASTVHSPHNVSRESHVEGTTERPADVGLVFRPSALHSPHSHPATLLALDITVTSSPSLPIVPRPDPTQTPVTLVHHTAQRWKLHCHQCDKQTTGCACKEWVQWCLDQGILRLPFSVDPFLGLGSFNTHNPPPALPPTFLARPHPAAATAFSLAQAAPRSLLPKADSATEDSDTVFKPSVWANRNLGLNASTGLAKHIHCALSLLNGKTQLRPDSPPQILGSPFSPHSCMQTVEALPLTLHFGT